MVSLWCGLQQCNEEGVLPQMCEVLQGPDDLKGGAAVQPCANFIQEESLSWPHKQLPCCHPLALPPADSSDLIITNQGFGAHLQAVGLRAMCILSS